MSSNTTSTDELVAYYWQVYQLVYSREPRAYYVGNGWYNVNGQVVHHHTLEREISQLYHLAKKMRMRREQDVERKHRKGAIRRIISKLRNL